LESVNDLVQTFELRILPAHVRAALTTLPSRGAPLCSLAPIVSRRPFDPIAEPFGTDAEIARPGVAAQEHIQLRRREVVDCTSNFAGEPFE
jgi:hypothetical protein